MANGSHIATSTPRPGNGEPHPTHMASQAEAVPSKRDLTSWWRQFKRGNQKREEDKEPEEQGIFGVPLQTSIRYANVAISLYNDQGESYIYGYVPIVVAKCGVFLKEKATDIEGIFRLSGSEKRIKQLRDAFNSPDRYGKGLDWNGYTVHDAANILRRYFNQLPEPIIPLEFYERFRDPLRNHQSQAVGPMEGQEQTIGDFDVDAAIRTYQRLITELPPLNRQLLLYILDLLAVFASKSDLNKMTTANLAAIFQPGILSHPTHDMSPSEYRLSQDVLIFLIEKQDHFLIGMHGTAADAQTVQEVESGPPTPLAKTPTTPGRGKVAVGRSSSNASAGAESIRKFGGLRRNVSVSSRHSKQSATASPVTTSFNGVGVHRSNTVPSKKSPAVPPGRFPRDRPSDPPTPTMGAAVQPTTTPVPEATLHVPLPPPEVIAPSSEDTTPTSPPPASGQVGSAPRALHQGEQRPAKVRTDVTGHLEADQADATPTDISGNATRSISNMFSRTPPPQEGEKKDLRRPNKLQKRRMPSSNNVSAHSSTQSLNAALSFHDAPASPLPPAADSTKDQTEAPVGDLTPQKGHTGATLKPSTSPSASYRSHSTATEYSEAEQGDETPTAEGTVEKEKKKRWRISGHRNREPGERAMTPNVSESNLSSSNFGGDSIHSSGGRGRQSLNLENSQQLGSEGSSIAPPVAGEGDNGAAGNREQEKKTGGPMDWLKGKWQERKDRHDEKQRAKSPPASKYDPASSARSLSHAASGEGFAQRGKSMEMPRQDVKPESSTAEPPSQQTQAAHPLQ